MRSDVAARIGLAMLLSLGLPATGCGLSAGIFNPAFINTLVGGQVPVTPGPGAAFILVRCINETGEAARFILTIQRDELTLNDDGTYRIDPDTGEFITVSVRERYEPQTTADGLGREIGMLFPCGESPVTHIGLGKNLLPTDTAVFVGGEGVGGAAGFGVAAGNLYPLQFDEAGGNFNCGDTVIFRAFRSSGVAGGVGLQSFLLPGSQQPSIFTGPSTFVNLEELIESQIREEEP
ncbi:MAG: hypothetical protein WBE26_10770 [Phycisphaerae bacterium]